MSSYPDQNTGFEQEPKKGWFGRNWWWFVPVLVILPITCCCCLPIGSYFLFQDKLLLMSPNVIDTVTMAESNSDVASALGIPLEPSNVKQSTKMSGSDQILVIEFDVTGPTGTGRIVTEWNATQNMISPPLVSAELTIDATGEVIDLTDLDTVDSIEANDEDDSNPAEASETETSPEPSTR